MRGVVAALALALIATIPLSSAAPPPGATAYAPTDAERARWTMSDMRSLAVMRDTGCPVVFDATHSVQLPGGQGTSSGGQREFVPVLARAAVAVGIAGLFMETHPDPSKALSDGPNAWPLPKMRALLETLMALDAVTKRSGFLERDV